MGRTFKMVLGLVTLLWAFLGLGTTVLVVSTAVGARLQYPAFWTQNLANIYGAAATLTVVVYFGLYLIAGGSPGSLLVLAAAVIAIATHFSVVAALSPVLAAHPQYSLLAPSIGWLSLVGTVCLGSGLLLGGQIRPWVAWTVVASAVLHALSRLVTNGPLDAAVGYHLGSPLMAAAVVAFEVAAFGIAFDLLLGKAEGGTRRTSVSSGRRELH